MTVHRFKKKPVEVEAMQLRDYDSYHAALVWINNNQGMAWPLDGDLGQVIQIETLEGYMTASHGDWIIRGVQGEFYPCKPDIFEQTYVVADGPVLDGEQCEAVSAAGFVCTLPPNHTGAHVAHGMRNQAHDEWYGREG